jgi:hypothetical protein
MDDKNLVKKTKTFPQLSSYSLFNFFSYQYSGIVREIADQEPLQLAG